MKTFLYTLIIVGFFLVSFFGLGPVLLAEGGTGEKITTLVIVFLLYGGLIYLLTRIHKK